MVSRVKVQIASARGVADRWRETYQNPDKSWTSTISGSGEKTYNELCKLGHNPDIDKVSGVIGNKSWSHLTCSGCGEYVEKGVDFGQEYSDHAVLLCGQCLRDGFTAIQK